MGIHEAYTLGKNLKSELTGVKIDDIVVCASYLRRTQHTALALLKGLYDGLPDNFETGLKDFTDETLERCYKTLEKTKQSSQIRERSRPVNSSKKFNATRDLTQYGVPATQQDSQKYVKLKDILEIIKDSESEDIIESFIKCGGLLKNDSIGGGRIRTRRNKKSRTRGSRKNNPKNRRNNTRKGTRRNITRRNKSN